MKSCVKLTATLLISLILTACSSQTAQQRYSQAEQLATQGQLTQLAVNTRLPIKAWGRIANNEPVHVYIEGDGHAWRNGHRPSLDPTPHNPVGLKLAASDTHPSVLYLGRPCQYQVDNTRGCHFSVWTERRFAETSDIKAALQQLINEQEVILIGFSGGANIAIQLATQLPQVTGLVTVAGNLDSATFNQYHRLAKEQFGQNKSLIKQLAKLPQLHYTGGKDNIIPPKLTRLQLTDANSNCTQITEVPSANHHGPWRIDWSVFSALQQACL